MAGRPDKLDRFDRSEKFDKFTVGARKVLRLAQEEAQRLNHNYIGTEHMLLGLIREEEGIAAKVLARMGVQLEDVRRAVEFIIGRGDRIVLGEVGLTPRAKKVLALAMDEAKRLGHHQIGSEYILLGLIREGEGIAAGVLRRFGVDLGEARQDVLIALNEVAIGHAGKPPLDADDAESGGISSRVPTPGSGPKANVVTCRIDDRDLDALDALVEAGIRSTRSDAASWLIHAGIETHKDLFKRVYATVEQIRQLRSEAQLMAIQVSNGGGFGEVDAPVPPTPPAEGEGE
jgi:Clp amino terminal domain, pathogenicity island component